MSSTSFVVIPQMVVTDLSTFVVVQKTLWLTSKFWWLCRQCCGWSGLISKLSSCSSEFCSCINIREVNFSFLENFVIYLKLIVAGYLKNVYLVDPQIVDSLFWTFVIKLKFRVRVKSFVADLKAFDVEQRLWLSLRLLWFNFKVMPILCGCL